MQSHLEHIDHIQNITQQNLKYLLLVKALVMKIRNQLHLLLTK